MTPELRETLNQIFDAAPPAPSSKGQATVIALERRYGITLPEDFRTYLAHAAPAEDWMDPVSLVILWRTDRLWSLRDELAVDATPYALLAEIAAESDQYIVFADFAAWCGYGYAICCSNGANRGKVAMIGSDAAPDRFIALSLISFLKLVAEDSDRLHWPGGQAFTDVV